MENESRKWLYNALSSKGYNVGKDYAEFDSLMTNNADSRKWAFETAKKHGYNVGKDYNEFEGLINPVSTKPQSVEAQTQQQVQAQPQPAAKPQATKEPYKPTWQEQMAFGRTINSAKGTVDYSKQSLDKTIQNLETYQKQQAVTGSVAKTTPKWNPETGQMEETYLTSAGTEHQSKKEAADIQRRLNDAYWREAHPLEAAEREIGQDLRDIRTEEERLTEQRKAAEGSKSPEEKTWWDYFKENFGASAVTGMTPMGSNVDRDMVAAEMTRKGAYGAERQGIMKEQDVLLARRRLAEEAQQLLVDVRKDQQDYGFLSGLGRAGEKVLETALNPHTWDFGEADLASQIAVANAVIKSDSGLGISSNEQKLLDTWAKNTAINSKFGDQLSGWTKAGMVTGESLPFMLEMAMNPASGLGEAATAQLVKYSLKKYGTKWVKDHAKSMLAKKIATRLVGDMVGAGVMASTTGIARVAADYENRVTGQVDVAMDNNGDIIYNGIMQDTKENPGAALFKALSSTSIENWSEMAGNYLGFINSFFGKALGKTAIGKAGRKMLAETGSIEGVSLNKAQKFIYELAAGKGIGAFSEGLAQFAKRTQWHGVINEYLEEEIGNIANAAVVGDMTFDTAKDTGIFNLEQNIDTFCGVALMGGFMSALNTVGYAAHRYNYDVDRVSNANAKLFGDDLWKRIQTTIDSSISDPRALNDTLTDLIGGDEAVFDADGKKAILKYTQAALEKQGAEMATYQPRMASSEREEVVTPEGKKYVVTSLDKNGETIDERAFDSEDEAMAYEGELKMNQQQRDYNDYLSMTNKLSYPEAAQVVDEFLGDMGIDENSAGYAEAVAAINDPKSELGKQFQQFKMEKILQKADANRAAIETFEQENGWTPGTVAWLAEQDPLQMDAEGLAMFDQARDFLETLAYPAGEVHVEHEQQVGTETAQAVVENVISTEEPIDPQNNAGQQLLDNYKASVDAMTATFDRNEELKEEFYRLQGMGLSPQEVISSLDSFRPDEVQTIIDWYNANARYQSFMDEAGRQIDSVAHRNRERRTFQGTINGAEDTQNVITITDGTNSYTLASGNISIDNAGNITGSDSGLIIGVDQNGDFVQLGDTSGYSVLPNMLTLDQWEDLERTRLQEAVSLTIDPNGASQAAAGQAQQSGNLDNVGGEAGAANGTGANNPPATAPVTSTQPVNPPAPAGGAAQPAANAAGTVATIESVTDKDGIKRYENGIAVDDAIADIIADGFDVNEIADASIAEAQQTIDKINGKATKTRKDLMDKKKAQDVIDYYNNVRARWAEVQQAEIPSESEENVNVQPEQPTITEKPVSSQSNSLTVEEQKQQRIAEAKAKYGELFDDDFTKANDVYELVSMWVGRKRNLAWDDVNGKRGLQKELGWTRKIGGDTKYIETLLAKKGEGMGVDEFVHMVWESPENDVNGEKRFDTDEIKNALLDLLKSATSKSDVVDYALNTRIAQAETALHEQQQRAEEEAQNQAEAEVEPFTEEQLAEMKANLPFPESTDEEIPDSPITQLMKAIAELSQQEGMPPIQLVDTDRMSESDWLDLAAAYFGGEGFYSQEDIDEVRNYVLSQGVFFDPETGDITVYSDGQTAEEVKYKVEFIKEQNDGRSNEEETGGLEAEVAQRSEEGTGSTQEPETPAAERADVAESTGSSESVTDEYLQPRNAEEEAIIQGVINQLQQEIQTAVEDVDKARADLEKAKAKESDRATDMFANDETFAEPDAIFSQEEMGLDTSAEGVERRTRAEREKLQEAVNKLNGLQSEQERNSRIRGALDNYRRQTKIDTEEQPLSDNPIEAIEQAAQQFREEQAEKNYGADNKLVTTERYEELKKKMKQKLLGQLNMNFDPEMMSIGAEMAMYHIEAGARKFADYATRMINDLGDAIRPYLQGFYEAARRMPGMEQLRKEMDSTETVDNFDVQNYDKQTANTVNEHKQENNEAKNSLSLQQETEETVERKAEDADKYRAFSQAVANDMLKAMETGEKPYKSIKDIRAKAKEVGLDVDDEGRTDILLQELVEDGLVSAARQYVNTYVLQQMLSGKNAAEVRQSRDLFNDIVKLYNLQPSITQRSSNRIKMQQYSTPLPMSFVADVFAYRDGMEDVLEPTAGNGMMVFAIPESTIHANELDDTRLDNLRAQKFKEVTDQDATQPFEGRDYDAIVANPPFGGAVAKEYDGKMIPGLAEQIALNALSKMKDNGRAAIIIGGNMEYAPNGAIKSDKAFFTYLYDHYNVKGVIDMDGKLYSKQGTTYPTRLILIDGRRSEEERAQVKVYPPVLKDSPMKVKTFEELFDVAEELRNDNRKTNGNEVLRTSTGIALPDNGDTSGNADRSGRSGQSRQNESDGRRAEREGSNGGSQTTSTQGTAQNNRRRTVGVQQPGIPGLFDTEETPSEPQPQTGTREGRAGNVGDTGRVQSGNLSDAGTSNSGVGLKPEEKPSGTVAQQPKETPKADIQQAPAQPVKPKVEEKRELETEKLSYRPHNTAFSLESVAPAAMVEAMDDMLKKIEKEHGSIDAFVTTELGYDSIEDMHNALAAEQVDSVAMAIYQMKQGQGMIIGDQTGVGKGRQMAALIRWACRQGKKPVFITQKADLFSDIYRDLVDIGSGELRPFIFNSDGAMVDGNGITVHKPLSSTTQAKVFAGEELPAGYDFAVLTYSQVNTGDKISQEEAKTAAKESGERYQKKKKKNGEKPTPKATFLRAIAKDNYLFLDESHTAAGKSNTGAYFQSILRAAKGVTFASATFAKRPDTMPMYAIRTAMSKAKVKAEELIKIIENGGVTLQEIMSRALTQAGQMVRRERDMSDVKTDWKTVDDPETVRKARENYDKTIAAFNAIIDFQRNYVSGYLDSLSSQLAEVAATAGMRQGTEDLGIKNVPFASKTYNYTKQLMLALKVDAIVDEVVKEIEAGRHPVIALENTMGSLLSEYSPGDKITDTTFAASLLKGLKGVLRYTITNEDGKQIQQELTPEQLGPEAAEAYYKVENLIRESTSGIFISPLDAIIEKLQAKGYKVGELTGRNEQAVLDENTGDYVVRRRTDKDKKKLARDFNSGALDVLILNKSASTGISLHASEKFSDQRQRTMIIAQPLADINDYMQMIGRIDRTGQVARGYYINLGLPVPAEGRFLMMLSTKLKSLNANTTTSQESESNDVEAPDLLNKYGSKVVVEYLRDNPDIYVKMGEPLKKDKTKVSVRELDEYEAQEDDARKITGYVALLPTKEQDAFYNEVVRRYTELIQYLNDTGSNDLKISVLPLRARTIDKQVSSEGADPTGTNPFAQDAYVEWVEMDVLKKPMKAAEIGKVIEQLNPDVENAPKVQARTAAQERALADKLTPRVRQIIDTVERETQAKLDKENERYEAAKARAEEDIASKTEAINAKDKLTAEQKQEAIDKYIADRRQAVEEIHQNMLNKIDANHDRLMKFLKMFKVGDSVLVPDDLTIDTFLGSSPGIFCGFKAKDEGVTPSTTLAVFATLDGRRKIEVKLSDWGALTRINNMTMQNLDAAMNVTLSNWDSQIPAETRKKGFIMTGNILQAFADAGQDGRVPGQLVTYTDIDGEVHDGILMNQHWEPSQLKGSTVPIKNRMEEIKNLPNGDHIISADGQVVISRYYRYYTISVPKSKKLGAQYYENDRLLDLIDGRNFYPSRGQLQGDVPAEDIEKAVNVLSDLGVQMKSDTQVQFDTETEMAQANANGRRFDEDINENSKTFSNQLDAYKEGKMKSHETFSLGSPSPILRACGIRAKKLILTQSVLAEHLKKHDLTIDDIRDLPSAINNPIMVYEWGDKAKSHVIITDLTTKDGRKITVTLRVNSDNVVTEVSKITSVHGKDATRLISEMNTDKTDFGKDNLKYVDKEKALNWLAMDSPMESRQDNKELDSAAKIINDFENPSISTDFNTSEASETEHKSRIAKHIDKLVEKLGTKARTTVYHSLEEVPEDVRKHIEQRHRQGKKVRGWYENGQIFLFLPDIGSEYEAEKTIWHETVAHHGLRELIGAENYDKLLRQLWLEHRDGEMGQWVTERMLTNGWNLNEAIDEYLAREAEKNPFKEPGLWQRLKWMVAEALHKMGFATDPTISDIQYLFWVSQNQLRENDPMSVIKQQAFLFNLEKQAANTPYVNMNAATPEDIDNPDAEGAYDDGIRHSEETDEEVIERLEKEPKVKVYRAMSLIDGKLYPPMATKQDGGLVKPIELGKWEKSDEHPEKAVKRNGKWVFKLTKDNGKSLYAAYNPYIHTSTTMLNDQFSEAQNRPNLVVVEVEVPESELTSGYKAEKAKDAVGKLEWKAGVIQGQLTGTREVILSRWDKPVRIVPASEVAQHIADQIKGKVEVMPTNVVTPEQRAELEKLGVKFVETDNQGKITEGENKGKTYSSVYGKNKGRRFDEDIEDPLEYSAKKVYDQRLNRVETVFSEAYQDAMVSLKTAQNAIAQDKDIPDSQNAYMAENLMHGKNKNEMDLFNRMFRDPLINTINKIMNLTGMNWGDIDRYVYTKSGLERNREFFVRDWLEAERNKTIHRYEDLNDAEQDIYDSMAATIEDMFEDGDITEEEKNKKLAQALQKAHQRFVNDVENRYLSLKFEKYQDLKDGLITFPEYLEEVDRFIRWEIDGSYKPEEHDYSGFRAMFGDEDGEYNEADIIDELMNTEGMIEAENVDTLWEQINAATQYGLERYREAGMRSDEQIDQIEQMFHWYVPMRGFKAETGEDMYQYFTGKAKAKSYVGGLLKHAKGRGSEANYPISTIFAMTYKAISDCNQNLVNQKFYRLCQANPNDLVILSDSWAVYDDIEGVWKEVAPDIPEEATEGEVREITLAWEEDMKELAKDGKAKKIKGKEQFDYKPMDKRNQSEHIVDVRINGQPRKMIVTGNPRMAQALNGQLRFEHGKNVFSRWNAAIKNFMASVFTSYSPTFALRNMFRDWTHFRTMLGVREGHGYASQANKYYRQSLFKMVGLFKKYREGTLDESKEMERDFKDFMDNGGITGFVFMQKIDDIQKEMENIYKKQKAGKTIRLNNNLWEKILGALEALNEGIENNARFATYRASRHYAGRTKARSAYDAKEITVNFNRKGAGSKTAGFKAHDATFPKKAIEDAAKTFGVTSQILGEGRIFFNATVQAIATTFKNFQNPDGSLNGKYIAKWAAKYAMPPFMFGLALPMINKALAAAFGGDDDDDPYANLAEWTRRRNICIYIGNNNFITIPIGQELAAFLTLGDIFAGNTYAPELKPVDRDFGDEMVGVMNTFSPVDISTKITKGGLMEDPISESVGRTFSVLAPLVAVEQNLGWTGRPIYREDKFQNDQYTPEYQMVYQSTNPVLVNASKLLHELGGGDDITRGKFEVNPAIIQYLWEQYTGGPGKVFSNTISIGKDAKDLLTGNETDFNVRKVEGLKAFVQQGDDRTAYYRTQAKYRKYKADAEKLYDAVKGYQNGASDNPEYLLKLEQITKGEDFVRMQIVREADKQLNKINKAANKAEGKERKDLRKLYNHQMKEVVDLLDQVGKE